MATESERAPAIGLVDNTQPDSVNREDTRVDSLSATSSLKARLTTHSVRNGLAKRKYAKWQPGRLGIPPADGTDPQSSTAVVGETLSPGRSLEGEFSDGRSVGVTSSTGQVSNVGNVDNPPVPSRLDILYENQRGWWIFGVPLFSHRSLLQFDPPAWVTGDHRASPVDVTNADVPDPSWKWAWPSWYVDMSGDVDEEGWQYSFAFGSRFAWHGNHPWPRSFVRRRRWVRLRVKKYVRPGAELPIDLNGDQTTTLSNTFTNGGSATLYSAATSARVGRKDSKFAEVTMEGPEDIASLLRALKRAIVDRERIEVLKHFISNGGEELHYLEEKAPDILRAFVFQTSRWQFWRMLQTEAENAGHQAAVMSADSSAREQDILTMQQRQDNLVKAAAAVRTLIEGCEVFDVIDEQHRTRSALHRLIGSTKPPEAIDAGHFGDIKGIPATANIGREGHIY